MVAILLIEDHHHHDRLHLIKDEALRKTKWYGLKRLACPNQSEKKKHLKNMFVVCCEDYQIVIFSCF